MSACLDENRVLLLVSGRLAAADARAASEHLDACSACHELLALCAKTSLLRPAGKDAPDTPSEPGAPAPRLLARGSQVGRYVVLDPIAAGGMGIVYTAYDPELDRKVALKLLRLDDPAAARQPLVDEAKALARLSHPNVVAVFEVGTDSGQWFLAMERVAGSTLADWLVEKRRGFRDVLAMFAQAGAGLCAAHEQGIVHRDFKPQNLLVGADGRVRVADFGLAQAGVDALEPARTIAGTVGYMAPEQRAGAAPTPASDQYSFCVALGDALAKASGRGPAAVTRIVARGRAERPGDRYSSLRALLDALERAPRRRRRWQAAALAACLLAAAGLGARVLVTGRAARCQGAAARLVGIWDPVRAQALERAFAALPVPFAGRAFAEVKRSLDDYAARFVVAHRDACEATRVRGEQSEALLDLRMQCLSQRLQTLRALTDALASPDRDALAKAPEAAAALPSLDGCADARALRARPQATDPAAVAALHGTIARAQAAYDLGRYEAGLEAAAPLAAMAERAAYRPALAEARAVVGRLQFGAGRYRDAETTLRAAERDAVAAAEDRLAALIAIDRVSLAYKEERYDEALERAADAQAALARLGNEDAALAATLANRRGIIHEALGRYDEAQTAQEQALTALQRAGGDPLRRAHILSALGGIASARGQYERAQALQEQALALAEEHLGPEHPTSASILTNLAETLNQRGRYDEALARWQRALAIRRRALRPGHPDIAESLRTIALALENQGKTKPAQKYAEEALALYQQALPSDGRSAAYCHAILADALRQNGELAAALAHAEQAAATMEKALGPSNDDLAKSLDLVAHVLADQHAYPRALAVERRALAMLEQALGHEHPDLTGPLTGLGEIYLGLGQLQDALPPLLRADALAERTHAEPVDRAPTWFALAQALARAGRDRAQAEACARRALAAYASAHTQEKEQARIERWLARHAARPGNHGI
jgi:tetratricopeptide (TPR) repeat protein